MKCHKGEERAYKANRCNEKQWNDIIKSFALCRQHSYKRYKAKVTYNLCEKLHQQSWFHTAVQQGRNHYLLCLRT